MPLSTPHNPFAAIEAAPEVLARHMVDRIFAEIPSYSRLGQASLYDDVYGQCVLHARLLPAVLRAGRAPNRDDFAFAVGENLEPACGLGVRGVARRTRRSARG